MWVYDSYLVNRVMNKKKRIKSDNKNYKICLTENERKTLGLVKGIFLNEIQETWTRTTLKYDLLFSA